MTDKQKQWLLFAVKLAIGAAIIAWLLKGQWKDISELFERPIHALPLVGTLVCVVALVLITFVRWFFMVRAQGLTLAWGDAFQLAYIGYFFNTFIPGMVGGDLVKAAYVAREQSQKAVAVATVMLDRIIGLYGMFVMGTIMTLVQLGEVTARRELLIVAATIWAAAAIGTLGLGVGFLAIFKRWRWVWWLTRLKWVGGPLGSIFRSLEAYREKLGVLLLCVAMSVLVHVLVAAGFYFAGLALAEQTPPTLNQMFFVCPVGMFLGAIPVSPGGLGVGEGAFRYLFEQALNQPAWLGLMSMLMFRIVMWLTTIPGFIFYMRGRQQVRELREKAEELAHLDEAATASTSEPDAGAAAGEA